MTTFRPNTWDENIWKSIVDHNEYGIVDNWPHNIIDIGGHIGSFTYFMLSKKHSKKSIVIEPDIENFNILLQNLQHYISDNKVIALNVGIGSPQTKLDSYQKIFDNTGGMSYVESPNGNIDSIPLDTVINMLDDSPILLKLDCEGCEYYALQSCSQLHRINAIIGEFHVRNSNNANTLRSLLASKNFNFSYHNTSKYIGLFGAHQNIIN